MNQLSAEQRCPECDLSCLPGAASCDCGYDFIRRESASPGRGPTLSATTIGLASGGAWFFIVLFLDRGWALPLSTAGGIAGSVASALGTGVLVTHLFRVPMCRARGVAFAVLPLLTVPSGIVIFSAAVWCARRAAGAVFAPPLSPREEFALILGTYAFYSVISLVGPVLFALAYANQRWARARLLGRTA